MPEPLPLDYERAAPPPPRNFGRLLLLLGVAALVFTVYLMRASPVSHRQTPPRARCSNNLRQIALGIMMYCKDNNQQYPSEISLLLVTEDLSADVFLCPNTADTKLLDSPAQQAATLLSGGHCSFVYVGAGFNSAATSDHAVAFEPPNSHEEFSNVMYGDGHVESQPFQTIVQLVPELEAGHNPPVLRTLTAAHAKTIYT